MAIRKTSTEVTNTAAREIELDIPFEELDRWFKGHQTWGDSEWSQLLNTLRRQGYKQLVDTPTGQAAIGKYLEEKRMSEMKLPTTELNKWLKGRTGWSHSDWSQLLSHLKKEGYSQLTDTEFGRQAIGKYLEEHKK